MPILPFVVGPGASNDLSNLGQKPEVDALILERFAPRRNALAPRGGVAFSGTNSARVTSPLTNQNIGTDPFSINVVFRVPTVLDTTNGHGIAMIGPDAGAYYVTGGVNLGIDTTGRLRFTIVDSTVSAGTWRFARITGFQQAYAGKVVMLTGVRDASGARLFVNGVQAAPEADATSGSPSTFAAFSVSGSFFGAGYSSAVDANLVIHSATLYNLALSATDVREVYELGGEVPERFKFGSQVNVASLGTNALSGGATLGSSTATSLTGLSLPVTVGQVQFQNPTLLAAGRRVRLAFDHTLTNLGANPQIRWVVSGPEAWIGVHANTVAGRFSAEFTTQFLGSNSFQLRNFDGSTAVTGNISNAVVQLLGAVVHLPLNDGQGFQLRDDSTNRLHAVMSTTGVTHVDRPVANVSRLRFTTNTNGNQQALGQVSLPASAQVLRVRARSRSGTPTVLLGTASGGNQVVASTALSTSWANLTIQGSLGISAAAASLWVNSNSTAVIEWDISYSVAAV